jgi:hypothetical protein
VPAHQHVAHVAVLDGAQHLHTVVQLVLLTHLL